MSMSDNISGYGSKLKNPLRTFKFRIYLLFVAKRRLFISEIQDPQSVAEFWESNFKNYLRTKYFRGQIALEGQSPFQ